MYFSFSADLFSKIESLQSDTLSDQRISPTPHSATPEPDGRTPPSSGTSSRARSSENLLDSPGEVRRRSGSAGKRPTGNNLSHKMLTVSKSIGVLGGEHRHYRDDHKSSSRTQFKRVQSGSSISNSQKGLHRPTNRSVSPPASFMYDDGKRISPPPPTSKPPPLPKEVKRLNRGGSHGSRTTAESVSSEESAEYGRNSRHRGSRVSEDSIDSLRADRQRHMRHSNASEHIYENRGTDIPQFFPQAHPGSQVDGPIYVNGGQDRPKSYARNRPINLSSLSKEKHPRPSMMPSPPRDDCGHPLDHVVNEAYTQKKPGSHSGGQKKHPQTQPPTTNLSSYPWHQARKTSGNLTSSKKRKDLTENTDLIQRGNAIFKKDMDEFRSHSDKSSSTHSSGKTPLSPSTHTLTLPEDPAGCETFV